MATVIISGVVSGIFTILLTTIKLKTRDATAVALGELSADTANEISQRNALQEEQKRLNEQRTILDAVRDGLDKGRSVEIGNLKLQVAALTEALEAEKQRSANEIQTLKERIRSLEGDLLQANIKIVRLQEGRTP